ncbi:hypothetical protein C0993_004392 [Termitomyces sp. T159_Od127]|nr:hypothetical protein C0993_004392 [Termitomyces sp. T159_Od127]
MLSPPRPRHIAPATPARRLPPSQLLVPATDGGDPARSLGVALRFELVHAAVAVHGYQLYAVEKWHVASPARRPADPPQVSVCALRPHADLAPADAQAEWDTALAHLCRDGARPKETPSGVVMATSLAHFRSDYTIVLIPGGDFRAVREQLYANINLLRMGCSGRSALTLEEPSDATKTRFISTYHMPQSIAAPSDTLAPPRSHSHSQSSSVHTFARYTSENSAASSSSVSKANPPTGLALPDPRPKQKPKPNNSAFIATVLELVKLIQAGLALFGMYGLIPKTRIICPHLDGLLCDDTVDGIRRWILDIGQPCVGLEPMERIADPMFVSALISLVLSVRNKLAAIGYSNLVPKDPFLQPHLFACALTNFVQSTNPTHQDPPAHMLPPSLYHLIPTHSTPPQLTPSTSGSSGPAASPPTQTVLTRELVDAIGQAYDGKGGTAESRVGVGGRRVRRAIRDKLRAGIDSDPDAGSPAAERGTTSGGEGGASGIGIVGGDHREGRDKERERETLGGVGTGVSSSGGQILSGIGSFASGLGLPVGPGASGATGAGVLMEATYDLGSLVRSIYSKGKGKRAIKRRGDEADLLGVGLGYGYGSGKEKEKDGGVALSVRALWSDQVNIIVKLREWEAEQEREKLCGPPPAEKKRWALSDGDVDDSVGVPAKSETEEESDTVIQQPGFRGMWGEKVQKKLGSWTGPFSLIQDARSLENTSLPTSEYERKVTEFNQKRPWGKRKPHNRISTWADPLSARELLDKERSDFNRYMRSRRRKRAGNGWGTSASASETWEDSDGYQSSQEDEVKRKETLGQQRSVSPLHYIPFLHSPLLRRRSFHDIGTLRGMRVMHVEHMRVDVELAGQFLIMSRREQHLQNVIACLQVLTSTLSATNSQLREDYTTHAPFISELDTHTQVIANIDIENAKADKTSQATNTLRYEAEQFRVPDLWHAAMPSRQKVFALREKVFGTGGRRLPPGVHGAHGRFNRLQWTLDGKERLVDHLGRTESEAEEEEPGMPYLGSQEEDEDEDVVQHPGIKPMWLLRFFTSWGAKWGVFAAASSQSSDEASKQGTPQSIPDISGNKTEDLGRSRTRNKPLPLDLPDTEDESISPVSVSS